MSSPPTQENGSRSEPGLPFSSANEGQALPSFASDASEGTLNPKLLGMQPYPGPLPRSHSGRPANQGAFKLPASSQPSMPALSTSNATALDNATASSQPSSQQPNGAPSPSHQVSAQHLSNGGSGGQQGGFPALHFFPLNDTFIRKAVHIPPQLRIKIGRQTNNKSTPAPNNGYFDSKVLSRTHAEVWFDPDSPAGPGVFIKDVGSSNGTFINGERLSGEGLKSDVFQLRDGDVVEFGIDIASEDNKTILHSKVAARIALALTPEDAERIAKSPEANMSLTGAVVRRMSRAPGMASSGMSFDHILQRLQSELQKSRETGQDLHAASVTLHKAHDAIHGNLPPPSMPSYPHTLPPVAPPQQNFSAVQSQLSETQASLQAHTNRVKSLEETIGSLKGEVERTKAEMELVLKTSNSSSNSVHPFMNGHHSAQDEDAMSDAGSIASVDTVRYMTEDNGGALRDEQESLRSANVALLNRIEQLSTELQQANTLSASLQEQHQSQADLLNGIQTRLLALEKTSSSPQTDVASVADASEQRWNTWKAAFETSWASERASWQDERAKLEAKIAELQAEQQERPRRRRRHRRRRDAQGDASASESSEGDHSAGRASTPSSPGSTSGSLPEMGSSKAGSSRWSQTTAVQSDHEEKPNKMLGHLADRAMAGSKGAKRGQHGSPTGLTTAVGAVGVFAVALVAWTLVNRGPPKD